MKKKIILHLCADLGSDSRAYQLDDAYEVIRVGKDIGIENYHPPKNTHGIFGNPPCTEFSTAGYDRICDINKGMFLVNHCLRIIEEAKNNQPRGGKLKWFVIENPAKGTLRKYIGKPNNVYQPWQYKYSPWTKLTALWGDFIMPAPDFKSWSEVIQNKDLYLRPSRPIKPSLALFHKSAMQYLPDYLWLKDSIKCDADIRSICSLGFSEAFKKANN